MLRRLTLLILVLTLAGCTLDPAKARDSIATAYGFISDLQTKHLDSCRTDATQETCKLINRGVAVQRIAASALNDYCSGPPLAGEKPYLEGGACSTQAGIEPRLRTALTDLNNIMKDIKVLK